MVDQRSILSPILHWTGLCATITVKTADCAAPRKHIQVVSESCAGYRFSVIACKLHLIVISISREPFFIIIF